MRARSLIPVVLSVVLPAVACDTSPRGILEPGGPLLLVVAPSAATIRSGGRLQLNLSAHDESGNTTHPQGVTWTTSNAGVADVGSDGVVTGRTTGGVQITAYWNGVHGNSIVSVVGDEPGGPPCEPEGQEPSRGSTLELKKVCVPK